MTNNNNQTFHLNSFYQNQNFNLYAVLTLFRIPTNYYLVSIIFLNFINFYIFTYI